MRDDQYVLNYAASTLARTHSDSRHDYGYGHFAAGDPRGHYREAWRFPVVDTCEVPPAGESASDWNDVTFIYPAFDVLPAKVGVVGSFDKLYEPVALRQVLFLDEPSAYFAVTMPVPRRAAFTYQFVVDGGYQIDPVNPQRVTLENGKVWSRFFTWECAEPIVLEPWELAILQRLTNHILPFRTPEAQRFLSWYYDNLDNAAKQGTQRRAYRLDDSAGAATYIDHLLAREESHHLGDYRKCLKQLRRIIRQRDPEHEPADVAHGVYVQLYGEMAANAVNGWDTADYGSPRYFLDLLRRHAFTGAFSHPKYGGNAAAAGWQYLANEFLFDWARSVEAPLGRCTTYLG